jgi:hypothetical protein
MYIQLDGGIKILIWTVTSFECSADEILFGNSW